MHSISIFILLFLFSQFSQSVPVERSGQASNFAPGVRTVEPIRGLDRLHTIMAENPNQVINWMTLVTDNNHALSLYHISAMVSQFRSYLRRAEDTLAAQGKAGQLSEILKEEAYYKPFINYLNWLSKQESTIQLILENYPAHQSLSISFLMEETIALSAHFGYFATAVGETPLRHFLFSPVTKLLHRYIDFDHIFQSEHQVWAESLTVADFMHSETYFKYKASRGLMLTEPSRAVHQSFQDVESKVDKHMLNLIDLQMDILKKKLEATKGGPKEADSEATRLSEPDLRGEHFSSSPLKKEMNIISHKSLPLPRIRTV